jgi:Transposase DDE domain
MGHPRALDPAADIWPRPEAQRRPPHAQRHPVRVKDRLPLGGRAAGIWLTGAVLAPVPCLVPGWHLGADVADALEPARCPGQAGVGASVFGWPFRAGQKRGYGIGKAKVGEGSKAMIGADGNGLPSGLYVASVRPHESRLAGATLATVEVPQRRGRPRTRPKELVADKGYDSQAVRRQLRRRGMRPTIPSFARRHRQRPKRGGPLRVGQATANAGRWSGALAGWTTADGWSCVMNAASSITGPFAWWPSPYGASP